MAEDEEGSELRYAAERCELLAKVKSTVDGLLASGSHVTWSTYGGLARISDNVEQVLIHGSRIIVVSGWVAGPVFIYSAINMLVGLLISIGFYLKLAIISFYQSEISSFLKSLLQRLDKAVKAH